jgi:hypothetical protein
MRREKVSEWRVWGRVENFNGTHSHPLFINGFTNGKHDFSLLKGMIAPPECAYAMTSLHMEQGSGRGLQAKLQSESYQIRSPSIIKLKFTHAFRPSQPLPLGLAGNPSLETTRSKVPTPTLLQLHWDLPPRPPATLTALASPLSDLQLPSPQPPAIPSAASLHLSAASHDPSLFRSPPRPPATPLRPCCIPPRPPATLTALASPLSDCCTLRRPPGTQGLRDLQHPLCDLAASPRGPRRLPRALAVPRGDLQRRPCTLLHHSATSSARSATLANTSRPPATPLRRPPRTAQRPLCILRRPPATPVRPCCIPQRPSATPLRPRGTTR